MSDERRQHGRMSLPLAVICEGVYEARTSDICVGGCFVDTISQVAVGESISLRLQLSDGVWLDVQGEVMYQLPPTGFGVRFTNLSDADRNRIEALTNAGT